MPLDRKIIDYLHQINEYPWVWTKMSCQGHYCKKIQRIITHYVAKRNKEFHASTVRGRIKSPNVLLEFDDSALRHRFVMYCIVHRKVFFNKGIVLYIVSPKKEKNLNELRENSVIVSKFGGKYVSVGYLMNQYIGSHYYRNKRKLDHLVSTIRDQLFDLVLWILDQIDGNLRKRLYE